MLCLLQSNGGNLPDELAKTAAALPSVDYDRHWPGVSMSFRVWRLRFLARERLVMCIEGSFDGGEIELTEWTGGSVPSPLVEAPRRVSATAVATSGHGPDHCLR